MKISNVKREINETSVDIDAEAKIIFEDGFFSKISSSFKRDLGTKSEIKGEKGTIVIKKTWLGGDSIIKINENNHHKLIKIENNKNIYSYQIQSISQNLANGIFRPQYPGMSLKETLLNMELIDEWLKKQK